MSVIKEYLAERNEILKKKRKKLSSFKFCDLTIELNKMDVLK